MGKTALVAGVTGIVGLKLAERLLAEGWKVYGLSRRNQNYLPDGLRHIAADLTSADSCKKALGPVTDVTHVFITTWLNKGSEVENCQVNELMVANLFDNLSESKLEHAVLVTGTKHYMGPFEKFADGGLATMPVPFRERLARLPYPNFYYNQEDVMFDRAKKRGFKWNVARPHTIIGFAPYNQMNMGMSLAVYASICKHLDLPFIFPGGPIGYDIFLDATDTDLLASHILWEVSEPKAANEAFNVVNGDLFRWRLLWRSIARYFDVRVEDPKEPIIMEKLMADKGPVWDEIVKKYGLKPFKLQDLTNWWFVNIDLGRTVSCPTDMNKSRELGFKGFLDTEKAYNKLFDYLRKNKYVP